LRAREIKNTIHSAAPIPLVKDPNMSGTSIPRKSNAGREYVLGQALSNDFRQLVINDMISCGADCTGLLPSGLITDTAKKFKVAKSFVSKLWRTYCYKGRSDAPATRQSHRRQILLHQDIAYLESLKIERPSMPYAEMKDKLSLFSASKVSVSTVGRAVRHNFSGGKWTKK
jgi:hypothetical protein